MNTFIVQATGPEHEYFADEICALIEVSASQRGTGIAKRSPKYISEKIADGMAIIALSPNKELVGFCYIESWSDKKYVANSGLIVKPEFRGSGVATLIKKKAFLRSRKLFPAAKIFGLTTSLPVMKINSELGYQPVTYDRLTDDNLFWEGCRSCVNYEILQSKNRQNCMCTAMLVDPKSKEKSRWEFVKKSKLYERFVRLKKAKMNRKEVEL